MTSPVTRPLSELTPHDLERLEDLLDEYEALIISGESPSLKVVCHRYPHLYEHLERRIMRLMQTDDFISRTLEPAIPPSTAVLSLLPPINQTSRFRDLRQHAQGGMGIVYKAQETTFGREVAVKVLQPLLMGDEPSRQQFEHEACITALLNHPGVVPIYGSGAVPNTGQPFYSMRLLEGESFKKEIDRLYARGSKALSHDATFILFRQLLTAFVSVCKTVDYAHKRGIIHCDLKPENVQIGKYGEVVVLDWGLARKYVRGSRPVEACDVSVVLPGKNNLTTSSVSGGTPYFMSPEQANGQDGLTPATDIYSLGAFLFVIITGKFSIEGNTTRDEVIQRVRDHRILDPKDVNPRLGLGLAAICRKAMKFSTSDRYPTAMDLAQDIENYLADVPINALPETRRIKLQRWYRRHQQQVLTTMAALLLIAFVSIVSAIYTHKLSDDRNQARLQAQSALKSAMQMGSEISAQLITQLHATRFEALENEAKSSEFVSLTDTVIQNPDSLSARQKLQSHLLERYESLNPKIAAETWFICDPLGNQIARAPFKDSVGTENYAHRDYFHGLGKDLTPEETIQLRPTHIQKTYFSKIYQSSNDLHLLKMAYVTPLWKTEDNIRTCVGILGMSVATNELARMRSAGQDSSQKLLVVDLRENSINQLSGSGFLVHHSGLENEKNAEPKAYQLNQQDLELLQSYFLDESGKSLHSKSAIISRITDPVTNHIVSAAISPIWMSDVSSETRPNWVSIVTYDEDLSARLASEKGP